MLIIIRKLLLITFQLKPPSPDGLIGLAGRVPRLGRALGSPAYVAGAPAPGVSPSAHDRLILETNTHMFSWSVHQLSDGGSYICFNFEAMWLGENCRIALVI